MNEYRYLEPTLLFKKKALYGRPTTSTTTRYP